MRILLSILSDYLQPNFLLIKEFEGRYDRLVFVSTSKMETAAKSKSRCLSVALSIPYSTDNLIVVGEDDYQGILNKLKASSFSQDDQYIINLTGGTKVMTAAVCDYFHAFEYRNVSYYYVPIGKNVVEDFYLGQDEPIKYQMTLREYFALYGIRYEPQNKLIKPAEFTLNVFEEFKKKRFSRRRYLPIANAEQHSNSVDRVYFNGAWFEDYCYLRIKQELNLPDNAICKSAKIYRDTSVNDNEIDVMFVRNNKLHICECKVTMYGLSKSATTTAEGYLYKLAAIAKDLGLRVDSYILTLHWLKHPNKTNSSQLAIPGIVQNSPMPEDSLEKRCRILGINGILDANIFIKKAPLIS